MPETDQNSIRGYLVSVFHRQTNGRTLFYGIGRLENGETFGIADNRLAPFFYIRESDLAKSHDMLLDAVASGTPRETTMDGEPVVRISATNTRKLSELSEQLDARQVRTYEADIRHSRHCMMHNGYGLSIRISGNWEPGQEVDRTYLNPTIFNEHCEPRLTTLLIASPNDATTVLRCCKTDTSTRLLIEQHEFDSRRDYVAAIQTQIRRIDPDVICGFDIESQLQKLETACQEVGVPYAIARSRNPASRYTKAVHLQGRQCLDAVAMLRHVIYFEDMSLENLSAMILHEPCASESTESWGEMQHDRLNCLERILTKTGCLALTVSRSLLTGLELERVWGSVAPFEFLYVSELHKRRCVAPTFGVDRSAEQGAPGGLVLMPTSGLYEHVFVFDFRSLYPSIIRTFNIDPQSFALGMKHQEDTIVAPNGAHFSREAAILPAMLETFFAERSKAKARNDDAASYMYKIIMNSFYGVLGGTSRFADRQLAGAITSFGHHLLQWTKALLESKGAKVLYGDTDSLFIDATLEHGIDHTDAFLRGEALCVWINDSLTTYVSEQFGVTSHLEMEFEKYYRRLVLPPARAQTDIGRAKGYAGHRVKRNGERSVDIVGMEAVRHDWTDVAHELQRNLLDLIFNDASPRDMEACVLTIIRDIRAGKRDNGLVYRKRLRKPIEAYEKSTPPHVKAARLMDKPSGIIHYLMTVDGPRPIEKVDRPIDYEHYIQKQITPIAITLAGVVSFDATSIITGQAELF